MCFTSRKTGGGKRNFSGRTAFPIVPFRVVSSEQELTRAVADLGCPCVLKTADFGYDGKGQQKIGYETDLGVVWRNLGAPTGVLEAWVPFAAELSVVVARGVLQNEDEQNIMQVFPPTVNMHENHILATSIAPAPLADSIILRAQDDRLGDRGEAGCDRIAGGGIFPDEAG